MELAPNTSMNARVGNESFLIRDVKECSMSDARLICHSTRISTPRIKMCIKMNHRNWPIDFVERTQDRENNGMVTAKTRPGTCEDAETGMY